MSSTLNIVASEHPIKSVTVFKSSKAEVVRTFVLDLKKGQNKVEIRGLPSSIDTQAIRVSGLGTARLFDVVCTVGTNNAASYAVESSSEVIRILKVKKSLLETEKRVLDHEAELLVSYGKTLTGEHVNTTQMSQFLEMFVTQGQKNLKAIHALSEAIIQVDRQIEAEEHKIASKRGQTRGEVTIVIGVDESEKVELKLTYIVGGTNWVPTYELHATNEDGRPLPSVTLHYRARVYQSTGEDWSSTALTLSTVSSDTIAKQIPQLGPLKIKPQAIPAFRNSNQGTVRLFNNSNQFSNNTPHAPSLFGPAPTGTLFGPGALFGAAPSQQLAQSEQLAQSQQLAQPTGFGAFGQPVQQNLQQVAFGSTPGSLFGTAHAPTAPPPPERASEDVEEFEEIELPKTISEPTTVVMESPMAISFAVHGESTIPSDGVYHRVSVAVIPFEAQISYVTIPRIDPQVYLQCQVKNSSDYRLLPGPVSIILDDSYVSKTVINEVNTGDDFICTLGNDASIKVTYSRKSKTVKNDGGSYSEAKNVTTYTTRISIHNKHQFALPQLIIRDIIPTCDDKRAKIILRKPSALVDAKDGEFVTVKDDDDEDKKSTGLKVGWEKLVDGKGGEKEGRFEWKWKVDAGKKVSLEAQWEVKATADVNWVETPFF